MTDETAPSPEVHAAMIDLAPLSDDTKEKLRANHEPATDRLRAFEDATFGEDAVRIRGQVERGYGSKFKEMTKAQARHYAALERSIVTEQALADAHTALIDAEAAHQTAEAEVEASKADIDAPSGE